MDVSQLIQGLSAEQAEERRKSAERLAQLGPDARAAAVPLVRACADADEQVREWATSALEEMGPCDKEDAYSLAQLLAGDADVGYWAATLLGRLESDAAPSVARLMHTATKSPEKSVRHRCVWALGMIGPKAREAEALLTEAASSDDPRLSRLAKHALDQVLA